MAEENVLAPAPTRSNEQIHPVNAWLPIGKGNLLLAFTASTNVPTIYIQQFWNALTHDAKTRANLNVTTKKPTPHVIHYCRFTKLIIYYLGSGHNIHRRPMSHVHVTGDDFLLGNLKFVPKRKKDEVFGKPIPQELITEANQNLPYYQQYLEMAARKPTTKKGEKKKTASTANKPRKPTSAKKSKPTPAKQPTHKKKKFNTEPQMEDGEYDLQRGIQMSLESFQAPVGGVAIRELALGITQRIPVVEGKGKGIATNEQAALSLLDLQKPREKSTTKQYIFQRRPSVTQEASTGPPTQPQDDTSANMVVILRLPQMLKLAGSNPGQSHVALVGPNPEPMQDDFLASVYPKVHESLKHTTEEQVLIENPPSSTETLSTMNNLKNNFTFGDQFLNDKPTEEDPGKENVKTKVKSTVNVPIHQASSSVPPLSTPIIDLSPPKPVSPPIHEPTVTATTETTPTLPLPPPPQQHSITDPVLASHVFALKKIYSEDTDAAHLPKIKTRPDWLKPVLEEKMPKTPEPEWVIPPNDLPKTENNWADALAKNYKDPEENKLLQKTRDMVSFIKWYCKQIGKSKLVKANMGGPAYKYGYTFLKDIVLRYNEYKFSEADFKNLHSNDFEDMYLLHLQGKLNHLSGADKVHLFNAVNLWIKNIVIRQRVEELDRKNQKKMMKETDVHKFSDDTLQRILEKLDHMVKYYVLFKFNPGMEHRIWSEDDKRRSKEFIKMIERRIKIRRTFRSLESFVSGRLRG
uniref:Histone deacetylase 14 n=1 Tax=Tanacetum cinerariifolium TaxID=118510 RepID=A0A699GRH1_TANCI|nr:hypothetical protein [Tanacetum cinerariifolium]